MRVVSCTLHAYWSLSTPLPNIIKTISKHYEVVMCTRNLLGNLFRGDKREREKMKQDLSFLHMTLLRDLCPCPMLSNYLKQYGSYIPYKILISEEIITQQKKCDLSLFHVTRQLVLISKYFKPSRSYGAHKNLA